MVWKKTISRGEHPVLLVDALVSGMSEHAMRKLLDLDFSLKKYKRVSGASFMDEDEFNLLVSKIKERSNEDKNYLNELTNNYVKTAKKLVAKAKSLYIFNFKGKSSSQINEMFIEFMEEYNQSTFFFYIPLFLEHLLEDELNHEIGALLKKRRVDISLHQALQVLCMPTKETLRRKHTTDLLQIGKVITENEKIKKEFNKRQELVILALKRYRKLNSLIKTHLEEYAWLHTYLFQIREYTVDEVVKELKEILKENIDDELKIIKSVKADNAEKYKKMVEKLKIPPALIEKIQLVQEWNYLRSYRVDLYSMIHYYSNNLFQAVAVNLQLTYDELLQLTYKEIVGIMKFGLFNRTVLESRRDGHGMLMEDGKAKVCTGYKLEEIKEQEKEPEKLKENKLYGTPAYSGNAEGKVHVVLDPYSKENVKGFKKGDILVARMTSTDYTPLIQKAGAIITDEGGILCHALVIAREFGIPCLVGTNVATYFLKDGYTIKVNADEGYAKIIKKN